MALNTFIVVWLGMILEMLWRVLGGEDPLSLLGIFAADIAFLAVGIMLVVLNRYYRTSLVSRALPFIAILTLTGVAFLNVTSVSLWFGIIVAGALILACVVATLRILTLTRADT